MCGQSQVRGAGFGFTCTRVTTNKGTTTWDKSYFRSFIFSVYICFIIPLSFLFFFFFIWLFLWLAYGLVRSGLLYPFICHFTKYTIFIEMKLTTSPSRQVTMIPSMTLDLSWTLRSPWGPPHETTPTRTVDATTPTAKANTRSPTTRKSKNV